jgi:cobalt-zinc-cadmium efflux system membrane fusion protein
MTEIKHKIAMALKRDPKLALVPLALVAALIFAVVFFSKHNASKNKDETDQQVEVLKDGNVIKFPSNSSSLDLIKTTKIKSGAAMTKITAPARVVMSAVASDKTSTSILFESSETTSLYSQYRQSKASLDRARKNFERVKDMYNNRLATSRDLSDAEGEMLSTQAIYSEFDVKLRAEGFNPSEFSSVKPGTISIIADVPESQLEEVTLGEQVNVLLSSFQDKNFSGKVVAIGDIVDQVTRTIKVRVLLNDHEKIIRPGMFGKVDFGFSKNSVNIPLASVITVEEQNYVFVATAPHQFERRAVTIINNDATDVIVLSGLSEDEELVISGAMLLKGLSFGY